MSWPAAISSFARLIAITLGEGCIRSTRLAGNCISAPDPAHDGSRVLQTLRLSSLPTGAERYDYGQWNSLRLKMSQIS
jgi:hypothetical protein